MKLSSSLVQCLLAAHLGLVSAGPATAIVPAVRARNAPGTTTEHTLKNLARGLNAVRIEGRDVSFNSNKTVLDTSWVDATLLAQGV